MRGRRAAADLEDPDVFLRRAGLVPIAPTQIVQRVFGRLLERFVDALGEQAVESGALVHFVEMRERLAIVEDALTVAGFHWRTLAIVQRAFHEIAGGQQVFQALLILNADAVTAEVIRDARGGDVGFALPENLRVGQVGGVVRAGVELHAPLFQPGADLAGFGVADLGALVVKRGLAEAFLEHAGGVEQIVGDDGVEHAHAAFIKHAHDGLVALQLGGQCLAELARVAGDFDFRERLDVIGLVRTLAGCEPLAKFGFEIIVREILAPERGVFHALFRERTVQVQHADEAGPGAGPVGDGEDRSAMRGESGEDVMRVLPDGFRNDERRGRVNVFEHFQAFALRINEAVPGRRVVGVRAYDFIALGLDGGAEGVFHCLLRRPANLVGRETQIAAGDELDLILLELGKR